MIYNETCDDWLREGDADRAFSACTTQPKEESEIARELGWTWMRTQLALAAAYHRGLRHVRVKGGLQFRLAWYRSYL